jgi:hypothetical protein
MFSVSIYMYERSTFWLQVSVLRSKIVKYNPGRVSKPPESEKEICPTGFLMSDEKVAIVGVFTGKIWHLSRCLQENELEIKPRQPLSWPQIFFSQYY